MKQEMLVFPNRTGRIFICLSHEDDYLDNFSDHFTIGYEYHEAIKGIDGENDIKDTDDVLLIINEHGLPVYVDSSSFALLDRYINTIALSPISLN